MHRFVGNGQAEFLADIGTQRLEIPHETVLAGEREIGMDHELAGNHLRAVGQICVFTPHGADRQMGAARHATGGHEDEQAGGQTL